MEHAITIPPRTIMEVYRSLPEGTLAEVIESKLYMSPSPNPFHQEISMNLAANLYEYVKAGTLGKIFTAPVDLYLDEQSNVVQPDILFISNENPLKIDHSGLHGVPDLIVEILSPSNEDHDRVTKKKIYEKFGVKEYWIVDPDTRKAEGYYFKDGTYAPVGTFEGAIDTRQFAKSFPF